jgi:hypothetical protein
VETALFDDAADEDLWFVRGGECKRGEIRAAYGQMFLQC